MPSSEIVPTLSLERSLQLPHDEEVPLHDKPSLIDPHSDTTTYDTHRKTSRARSRTARRIRRNGSLRLLFDSLERNKDGKRRNEQLDVQPEPESSQVKTSPLSTSIFVTNIKTEVVGGLKSIFKRPPTNLIADTVANTTDINGDNNSIKTEYSLSTRKTVTFKDVTDKDANNTADNKRYFEFQPAADSEGTFLSVDHFYNPPSAINDTSILFENVSAKLPNYDHFQDYDRSKYTNQEIAKSDTLEEPKGDKYSILDHGNETANVLDTPAEKNVDSNIPLEDPVNQGQVSEVLLQTQESKLQQLQQLNGTEMNQIVQESFIGGDLTLETIPVSETCPSIRESLKLFLSNCPSSHCDNHKNDQEHIMEKELFDPLNHSPDLQFIPLLHDDSINSSNNIENVNNALLQEFNQTTGLNSSLMGSTSFVSQSKDRLTNLSINIDNSYQTLNSQLKELKLQEKLIKQQRRNIRRANRREWFSKLFNIDYNSFAVFSSAQNLTDDAVELTSNGSPSVKIPIDKVEEVLRGNENENENEKEILTVTPKKRTSRFRSASRSFTLRYKSSLSPSKTDM